MANHSEHAFIDITGCTFGLWLVLRRCACPSGYVKNTYWLCKCLGCKKEKPVTSHCLRRLRTEGCASCHLRGPHPWKRKRPFESLFNQFQRNINAAPRQDRKVVKRESTLIYEEFLTFTVTDKCHYCWSPIAWTEFDIAKNGTRYNLDRKDNGRGYDLDNLVVCCKDCNAAKGSRYDYETWFGMTEFLRNRKRGN
jgi:5-methylcytosine-specific restriction endonuclease McrA